RLVHAESDLVLRALRDVMPADVSRIVTDDLETAERVRETLKSMVPAPAPEAAPAPAAPPDAPHIALGRPAIAPEADAYDGDLAARALGGTAPPEATGGAAPAPAEPEAAAAAPTAPTTLGPLPPVELQEGRVP